MKKKIEREKLGTIFRPNFCLKLVTEEVKAACSISFEWPTRRKQRCTLHFVHRTNYESRDTILQTICAVQRESKDNKTTVRVLMHHINICIQPRSHAECMLNFKINFLRLDQNNLDIKQTLIFRYRTIICLFISLRCKFSIISCYTVYNVFNLISW